MAIITIDNAARSIVHYLFDRLMNYFFIKLKLIVLVLKIYRTSENISVTTKIQSNTSIYRFFQNMYKKFSNGGIPEIMRAISTLSLIFKNKVIQRY